ncbi:MAG: hypothetical protein IJ391_02655 [Clostridia bacterium]|nr:hypothetical protein [Clostridia bacterium]
MKKKQKKILMAMLAVLLLICLGVLWLFIPYARFSNAGRIDIVSVEKYTSDSQTDDLTSVIDVKELKMLISKLECAKIPLGSVSDGTAFPLYNITFNYFDEQWTVVLGEGNILYQNSDTRGYIISNSLLLIQALDVLTAN